MFSNIAEMLITLGVDITSKKTLKEDLNSTGLNMDDVIRMRNLVNELDKKVLSIISTLNIERDKSSFKDYSFQKIETGTISSSLYNRVIEIDLQSAYRNIILDYFYGLYPHSDILLKIESLIDNEMEKLNYYPVFTKRIKKLLLNKVISIIYKGKHLQDIRSKIKSIMYALVLDLKQKNIDVIKYAFDAVFSEYKDLSDIYVMKNYRFRVRVLENFVLLKTKYFYLHNGVVYFKGFEFNQPLINKLLISQIIQRKIKFIDLIDYLEEKKNDKRLFILRNKKDLTSDVVSTNGIVDIDYCEKLDLDWYVDQFEDKYSELQFIF